MRFFQCRLNLVILLAGLAHLYFPPPGSNTERSALILVFMFLPLPIAILTEKKFHPWFPFLLYFWIGLVWGFEGLAFVSRASQRPIPWMLGILVAVFGYSKAWSWNSRLYKPAMNKKG